jgi:predicted lipoprotein with Yx(FWY)xxD motif
MKRIALAPIALLIVAAVVVAGCGSGGGGSATAASPGGGSTAAKSTSVVTTKKGPLGTYLVDGSGRTLYLFEADKRNMSNCTGACLSIWPAFGAGSKPPLAKGGVVAGKLGVTTGSGKQIVTYNGHPLYYYAADQNAGDTSGQDVSDFGASWHVVNTAGSKIGD